MNNTVGYLSTVQYKCNEGYEMIGRALLTCDIDERWNGPPPRCESEFEKGIRNLIGNIFSSATLLMCSLFFFLLCVESLC